jgi:hypothetical protein
VIVGHGWPAGTFWTGAPSISDPDHSSTDTRPRNPQIQWGKDAFKQAAGACTALKQRPGCAYCRAPPPQTPSPSRRGPKTALLLSNDQSDAIIFRRPLLASKGPWLFINHSGLLGGRRLSASSLAASPWGTSLPAAPTRSLLVMQWAGEGACRKDSEGGTAALSLRPQTI